MKFFRTRGKREEYTGPRIGDRRTLVKFAYLPKKVLTRHNGTVWVWCDDYIQEQEYSFGEFFGNVGWTDYHGVDRDMAYMYRNEIDIELAPVRVLSGHGQTDKDVTEGSVVKRGAPAGRKGRRR